MKSIRSTLTAAAVALSTGVALVSAAPAFADGPDHGSDPGHATSALSDPLVPVTDPARAVVGAPLTEDQVVTQLHSLAGTQSAAEIDDVLTSGMAAAMMTDPETADVVAAVLLPIDLRALTR